MPAGASLFRAYAAELVRRACEPSRRGFILFVVPSVVLMEFGMAWICRDVFLSLGSIYFVGRAFQRYFLSAVLLVVSFMNVFTALLSALGEFFTSSETLMLLTTPLPDTALFLTRFVRVLVKSCWMVILMALPLLIGYGLAVEAAPWFYPAALLSVLPFSVAVASLGVLAAYPYAAFFSVKSGSDTLKVVLAGSAGLAVLCLRILRPERLIEGNGVFEFASYLYALHQRGMASHLPTYDYARVLETWAGMRILESWHPLLKCAAAFVLPLAAAAAVHLEFYHRLRLMQAVSGGSHRPASAAGPERAAPAGLRPVSFFRAPAVYRSGAGAWIPRVLLLAWKDCLVLARTPMIWAQVVLLAVISAIYLYNVYHLPFRVVMEYTPALPVLFMLVNVVIICGLIITAAVRFGFPSMSLEGPAVDLVRSMPFRVEVLVLAKFTGAWVPLAAFSSCLLWGLWMVRPLEWAAYLYCGAALLFVSSAIAALSVYMGTVYADYRGACLEDMPSSTGGMVFMVEALLLVFGALAFMAYPFYCWYRWRGGMLLFGMEPSAAGIVLSTFLLVCYCCYAVAVFLRGAAGLLRGTGG